MLRIIQAAKRTGKKVLWVGTAAIADNLMRSEAETPPAFGICGSVSEVTNRQIHEAEKAGIQLVSVSIPDLLRGTAAPWKYEEKCIAALMSGRDTILLSSASYDRSELEASVEAGRKPGMNLSQISVFTQNVLGEIAISVMDKVPVSGIFLTGGDIAISLLRKAGAEGSYITQEIALGIPKMKIAGGRFDGMPAVTKAGAFGKEDAIVYALRKLKEKD